MRVRTDNNPYPVSREYVRVTAETLRPFIETTGTGKRKLVVCSRDAEGPLEAMLAETFEARSLEVTAEPDGGDSPALALESPDEDTLVALLEVDGTGEESVVATSTVMELYDALLAIYSDLFVTGAQGLGDIELPDVLAALDDFRLEVRGYPLAHKEKFLLIIISRYIEQLAWETGAGTLRSSFQDLSRVVDEVGTYEGYDTLGDTDVDVTLYGEGSNDDPIVRRLEDELGVSARVGETQEHRDAWFVVYRPPDATSHPSVVDIQGAALVCLETEPRVWDGFWTYDSDCVGAIERYIATEL